MRFLDFFAGIGGFRRGMELEGHECAGFCEYDPFAAASYTSMHLLTARQRDKLGRMDKKKRQKEILKEEYRNGEWYEKDVRNVHFAGLPEDVQCWCFGSPCQDFSIAGSRSGLEGDRSSLIREIFRILEEAGEEDRPEWLIYENVKGMLSSNRGLDYLSILSEMDRLGYDAQWQTFNTAWFLPQNRERVYTVAHLRIRGGGEVFPYEGAAGENPIRLLGHKDGWRTTYQVFGRDGATGALMTCGGGGRVPHVALPFFCDETRGAGIRPSERSHALVARYYKGMTNRAAGSCVCLPVLTPDRGKKRQNGRRFKEDGDPAFTLTTQDCHGVALGVAGQAPPEEARTGLAEGRHDPLYVKMPGGFRAYAVWYEKYQSYIVVRRLTPKECFRLQGWEDKYFLRAAFVNSDSQLYKQAGNGVTVPVVQVIARRLKLLEQAALEEGRGAKGWN